MKKIYALLLLFVGLFINAQEKELGGTPVKGIIPISRTDFNSRAVANRISEQQPQTLTPGTPTGSSTEVGVTQGQLSVSLSGGANYNIPIAVPPGINGIVPQIGLAYNSQGSNGLAGYGWNITGVSVITRIPATKYHDRVIDAVDFDNLDRFALDGQRLIVKDSASVYGANETVYQTEGFSNLKITSYGVSSFGTNFGPQYFIVQYPDGSKAYYGNSLDSRSQTDWAITYWENPQGVRISYQYYNSNNSLSIYKVLYGSLGTVPAVNEIEFVYKNRQRPEQAFIGGVSFTRNTILSNIKVVGNGVGFRNYTLNHNVTTLGYERLISITETSGDNTKSLNPTVFSYDDFDDSSSFFNLTTASAGLTNVRNTNTANINGDFDGDGKIDMILYPISSPYGDWTNPDHKKKYWLYTDIQGTGNNVAYEHSIGSFEEIFPVTWLGGGGTYGYKLSHTQGWNIIKYDNTSNVTTFLTYSTGSVSPIYLQDQKTYQFPKFTYGYWKEPCIPNGNKLDSSESNQYVEDPIDPNEPVWVEIVKKIPKTYLNGDFNGDGLTDVIVIERPVSFQKTQSCSTYTTTINGVNTYFVNLDRRLTNNYVNPSGSIPNTGNTKFFVCDFNGDGKSDIIVIDQGMVKVYVLNDNKQLVLLFFQNNSGIKSDMQILIGDYNGDGKSDFVIPQQYDADSWSFFFSNGINLYNVVTSSIGLKYFNYHCDYYTSKNFEVYHMSNDFNGDGKTDIFQFGNSVEPNRDCDFMHDGEPYTSIFRMAENKISGVGQITFNVRVEGGVRDLYNGIISTYGIRRFPLLTLLDYKNQNNNLEFSLIVVDKIHTFSYKKDNKKDTRLKEITLGNGVKEAITYKPLKHETDSYTTVYGENRYTENYPNLDIVVAPNFYVVSKLEKSSLSVYKKQEYKYYGAVSNVAGLGFLGFRSTAKTNWFNDDFEVISNVSKFDVAKRGAAVESLTLLGNYLPSSSLSPTVFINKSTLTYQDELLANKVYKIKNTGSVTYNGLEGTSKEVTTSYDEYNNPISNYVYTKQGANTLQTDVTIIEYDNFPLANPYIIGRPIKKNTSSDNWNLTDHTDAEEKYTYSNSLLTKIEKRGYQTDYITEDNVYDSFGNITKKTISASGITPRETNYVYDPSGRFLTKSIDIETLETDFTYNLSNGLLLKETLPSNPNFALKTDYLYDVWGKKIKITDYLGKSKDIVYSNSSNPQLVSITETGADGSSSFRLFDDLGREMIGGNLNIDNTWSYVSTEYDIYDRKIKISEPYIGLSTTPTQFTTTSYDKYGRLIQTVEHTGKTNNISYSGLTSVVTNGVKTETITKNALGNVVSKTDNGGTIAYEYFVNGNLKKSVYNNSSVEIEYDGFGRKNKLTDPSAGIYEYTYNILGEPLKEITPNGVTEYTLNGVGKVTQTTIIGPNTNSKTTYTFNPDTKLLATSRFDDIISNSSINYLYGYDGYKRLIDKEENTFKDATTPLAVYKQTINYDLFGRPEKQRYTATLSANNKSSDKWVKNTYKNGFHWQIIDDATGQELWKTNTVNAYGKITGASYGNGIVISNTYDQYGFPSQSKHDKTGTPTVNIMTLNTVFEPQRGNLTSKSNSLFNMNDNFEYDNIDRLIKWSLPSVVLYNELFTSGVGGFAAKTNASIINEFGRLKVTTVGATGAKKTILSQAVAGDKLVISLSVDARTTGGGLSEINLVGVDIVEINNETGIAQTFNKMIVGDKRSISFEHIVSQNSTIEIHVNKTFFDVENTASTYFYIDNLVVTKYSTEKQTYDDSGRILQNAVGNYNYDQTKVYRNISINPTPDALAYYNTRQTQNVSYNVFKGPVQIEEVGIDKINYLYNPLNTRSSMFYGGLQTDIYQRPLRKHFSADGTMEIKHNVTTGAVEFVTYIGGDGYTAPVVLKSDGTTQQYLYLHRDYQGSIVAITNQAGAIVEKRLFDVWGAILKVQDGNGNILTGLTVLDRGYTGHEHLQTVGLIHMNGRLYDPKLHRFLQPDNNVQDPYNTQNFNRYGYVMNNPTKFTDPSGEFWHLLIAAAVGGTINLISNWNNIHNIGEGLAAFGAGAGAGVLALYGPVGWAAGGALVGGTNAWLANGNPLEGAVMGGISGVLGGAVGKWASGVVGSVVVNGIKVSSPLLQGTIVGSLAGALTSGATGFSMALASGASFEQALDQGYMGMKIGFVTGTITGALAGYTNAKNNGINPINGKKLNYPANNGGIPGTEEIITLPEESVITRYGSEKGTYASPEGTSFSQRSLPPEYNKDIQLNSYKVIKPLPNVESSTIAPYYFQEGYGTQYKLPNSIEWLLKNNYIIKL